jgi:hypothetical protein
MPKRYLSVLLILLFVPVVAEAEGQPVGIIKTLEGDATVLRGEQKIASVIGIVVLKGDIIETSASGTVGILFNDDSIISLGPESKLDMKNFAFNPKEEKFAVFMKMLKGTFVYISGAIGRLSPDSVKLETPSSIIGTRGTKVLIEVKGV